MKAATLAALVEARRTARPVVLATRLSDGAERLIDPLYRSDDALDEAARKAAASDVSQKLEIDGETWFLNVFNPPVRLAIVGAVHIAQPLSRMAGTLGWRVHVIDPRTAFSTPERFPDVTLSTQWPDEGLEAIGPDARTAVVTLTHDPKLDDPALSAALKSRAFYIGALGSKKTHAARRERLTAAGFGTEEIARIRGPVGLDINAKSPPEIAVSILAEIVETLRAAAQ